jgi:hypothetical protein
VQGSAASVPSTEQSSPLKPSSQWQWQPSVASSSLVVPWLLQSKGVQGSNASLPGVAPESIFFQ